MLYCPLYFPVSFLLPPPSAVFYISFPFVALLSAL